MVYQFQLTLALTPLNNVICKMDIIFLLMNAGKFKNPDDFLRKYEGYRLMAERKLNGIDWRVYQKFNRDLDDLNDNLYKSVQGSHP